MGPHDHYEADGWTSAGPKITSKPNLDAVRAILDREGSILVKHWHYRAATGPTYQVFEADTDFLAYLEAEASPGDAFDIWSLWEICAPDKIRAQGKRPDEAGRVPTGGAY